MRQRAGYGIADWGGRAGNVLKRRLRALRMGLNMTKNLLNRPLLKLIMVMTAADHQNGKLLSGFCFFFLTFPSGMPSLAPRRDAWFFKSDGHTCTFLFRSHYDAYCFTSKKLFLTC
jgi:hypothetical protein